MLLIYVPQDLPASVPVGQSSGSPPGQSQIPFDDNAVPLSHKNYIVTLPNLAEHRPSLRPRRPGYCEGALFKMSASFFEAKYYFSIAQPVSRSFRPCHFTTVLTDSLGTNTASTLRNHKVSCDKPVSIYCKTEVEILYILQKLTLPLWTHISSQLYCRTTT